MNVSPDTIVLLRIFAQTLAVSLVFTGAGCWLVRASKALAPAGPAMSWGRGYFVGLSAFLAFFVPASRVLGARVALAIALLSMAVASFHEAWRWRDASRRGAAMIAAVVTLFAGFVFIDFTRWLMDSIAEGSQPGAMWNLGSIHSGRYANYGWFIAEFDFVPRIAQNGAQSILGSIHLMLGVDSPLSAVMAWIPASLTFFALFLHGLYQARARVAWAAGAAVFTTLFCNVAVSLVHVVVFDNGSPIAFIGYADLVIAAASFVIFCTFVTERLDPARIPSRAAWGLPALLALTWPWYAPQDALIAFAGVLPALVALAARRRSHEPVKLALGLAALCAACVTVGGLQFGPFLPRALQEETGLWAQDVASRELAVRPYGQWIHGRWDSNHWNVPVIPPTLETRLYDNTLQHASRIGRDEAYLDLAWLVEEQVWASVRVYGFALLGLAAFAWMRRGRLPREGDDAWLLLSAFAFAAGFAMYFLLELMRMKWWLTRFLVPGVTLALTCLCFAALDRFQALSTPLRRGLAWSALAILAAAGPLFELGDVFFRNLQSAANGNTLQRRIASMVTPRGPFLFESLKTRAPLAEPIGPGQLLVGSRATRGVAIETPPMAMRAGAYRASFRVQVSRVPTTGGAAISLAAIADGHEVARRSLKVDELSSRHGTPWADLEFDLPRGARAGRVELSLESDGAFVVSDVSIRRIDSAHP